MLHTAELPSVALATSRARPLLGMEMQWNAMKANSSERIAGADTPVPSPYNRHIHRVAGHG